MTGCPGIKPFPVQCKQMLEKFVPWKPSKSISPTAEIARPKLALHMFLLAVIGSSSDKLRFPFPLFSYTYTRPFSGFKSSEKNGAPTSNSENLKKKNDEYVGRNDQLSLAKNMREGAKYTLRERLEGLRATLAWRVLRVSRMRLYWLWRRADDHLVWYTDNFSVSLDPHRSFFRNWPFISQEN